MKKNNHQKAFQAQSRFRQILNWLFDRYESKCSTRHDHKNEIAKAIDDYFDDDWDKQQLIELIADRMTPEGRLELAKELVSSSNCGGKQFYGIAARSLREAQQIEEFVQELYPISSDQQTYLFN